MDGHRDTQSRGTNMTNATLFCGNLEPTRKQCQVHVRFNLCLDQLCVQVEKNPVIAHVVILALCLQTPGNMAMPLGNTTMEYKSLRKSSSHAQVSPFASQHVDREINCLLTWILPIETNEQRVAVHQSEESLHSLHHAAASDQSNRSTILRRHNNVIIDQEPHVVQRIDV